ncbi:MAG: tRNA (N6-isopentenyl adenosine(37)-C2)-methylthiotransferase MiaB [Planctomycetes bacterium]|nr:tRNA (N6-isopentenyl adenosine(37)-C2)-methylthiotransferase MiaB [Planctomycetota bacterium]
MTEKRIHIKSYGCQMNKLDTALVSSAFKDAKYTKTEDIHLADIVRINTCSVRQHAEDRVISNLGYLKHLKKSKPDLVVGVIGCMGQRLGEELLAREEVDLVCGPDQIPHIVDLCHQVITEKTKVLDVSDRIRHRSADNPELEAFESMHDSDDKAIEGQAFVRVMRGCNYFCTFCIVPFVRGPEVSRPIGAIVDQVKRLAADGVRQVTLLGQTVNAYECRAGDRIYSLADVLEQVHDVEGIDWIRFITNYPAPKYFDGIMNAIAHLPKVCKYFHMPAQSGSDRILEAMNRKYTCQEYLDLIDRARGAIPDLSLAGDFIVGFPGETEEDFQASVELVKKVAYKNSFVFKYSPRPGTTSEKSLEDDVSAETKAQRNVELLAVQESVSQALSRQFLGQRVRVLVEGLSKKPHLNAAGSQGLPQLVGRTDTDWIVVFNGPRSLTGRFVEVTIDKTSPLTLFGQLPAKLRQAVTAGEGRADSTSFVVARESARV